MRTDLKKYEQYRSRLLMYAKALNIKIEYTTNIDSDGVYIPLRKLIKIDSDIGESEEIAALLHELGHVDDDSLTATVQGSKKFKALNKAYTKVYKNKHSKKQSAMVLRCERRAWKYGRALAKKLRIKLGRWYDLYMQQCIQDYKK